MLPKIVAPEYTVEIPSTKVIIKYRPFLVKEEKILLMAKESQDIKEIVSAMKSIITSCTFDKVNVDDLTTFDVEYLFLQLRSKSVGEKSEVSLICNKDTDGVVCKNSIPLSIDLTTVNVVFNDDHTDVIELTDNIGCKMIYPDFEMLSDIQSKGDVNDADEYELIARCIEYIWEGEELFYSKDLQEGEISDFLDTLSHDQDQKIKEFFATIPAIKHTVKYKCPECKKDGEYTFVGTADFFT